MRRRFLPILVCALWLASLAGAGWARARCMRACAEAKIAQLEQMEHVPSCCAKLKEAGRAGERHVKADCTTCPKCKALAKAQLSVTPPVDAPLFFDAVCGTLQPVVVASSAPVFAPPRAWQWSLPPPDTLLTLHCQLLI